MVFVGVSGASIWILFASACRPFHKLWQILPDPGPYCFPQSHVFLITVLVLNLVTDLCIILIPIPIILPLKISWGRKFGLLGLFCAGVFVMIAAILRVYFVLAVSLTWLLEHIGSIANTSKASKGRDCCNLELSRRCCGCHCWAGDYDPPPLHSSVLEQRSAGHVKRFVKETFQRV